MSASPSKTVSASPKSSPSKKEIDAATAALNHFAQGKRHLVVGDIQSAVNSLQEACRYLAEEYGETAPECGDAYFHYGKALLEMARIESGVLGNALDGEEGSTEDDEEEDEDGDSQEGESQDGDSQDEGSSKEETKEDNDESKSNDEEGEKTEEDEEEVSNLQLAWEMLELSKIIFQKQEKDNPEMTKKVAQVFLTLGEVGLESENYAQGIEDFKQCLEIQEKNLEKDDRCLAETHYHLGVAFSFSDDFDKAVEHFQAAVNVIELRISNLNKRMKEKETWTEEQKKKDAEVRPDPFYTEQGEIDELEKLLPEIREKIVDMEEMKKDTKEKMQKAAKAAFMAQTIGGRAPAWEESGSQGGFDAPSSSSSKSEAKSITHLVRKKQRKSEDEATAEVKKAKVENGETTNSKTKSTNGQSENVDMEEKESSKGQSVEELKKKAAEDMKKTTKDITKEHSKATT